jgi:acetyltransferase-like isoleucine patch superfamily enzyme
MNISLKSRIIRNLANFFLKIENRLSILRIQARSLYPKLAIANNVNMDIKGCFTYGNNCTINSGSNIIIPLDARLTLGDDCYLGRNVEIGPLRTIKIGDKTSIQDKSIILGQITIGRSCIFGPNVYISSGSHRFRQIPEMLIKEQDRLETVEEESTVTIHDDCWFGANAVIMPGVTIGRGCVVGANCVVTKSIAPYKVVAGAPGRVISNRLEFKAPAAILCNELGSTPYFYSGFKELRILSIGKEVVEGYAVEDEAFTLCLELPASDTLNIVALVTENGGCELEFMGQIKKIFMSTPQRVSFHFTADHDTKPHFTITVRNRISTLLISRAWLS